MTQATSWLLAVFGAVWMAAATAAHAQAGTEALQTLAVVNGRLPAAQQAIVVTKGAAVRWRVTSTTPGELHLHAYRLRVAVQPGVPAELAFTAHATGRFRVEWHAAGAEAAAPGGQHHGPPLATFDVRPR